MTTVWLLLISDWAKQEKVIKSDTENWLKDWLEGDKNKVIVWKEQLAGGVVTNLEEASVN